LALSEDIARLIQESLTNQGISEEVAGEIAHQAVTSGVSEEEAELIRSINAVEVGKREHLRSKLNLDLFHRDILKTAAESYRVMPGHQDLAGSLDRAIFQLRRQIKATSKALVGEPAPKLEATFLETHHIYAQDSAPDVDVSIKPEHMEVDSDE
jgi:hypothetical protein